ncbi:MAG: YggT family protein [Minwuia sp.]|nr:YggT family protein [Minwuia sp.]
MAAIAQLIDFVVDFYIFCLIASAIMSWLVAFNVLNPHNNTARTIGQFLYRITEPALGPIRRLLPDLGGIDLSPVVLIIGLMVARTFVICDVMGFCAGYTG